MAGSKSHKQEHAFKTIDRDIKADAIANVMLLHGEEQYLVHWAINAIADKYINETVRNIDFIKLQPEQCSVDALIETCETLSMFSRARVVVAEDFSPLGSEKSKGISESDEAALFRYVGNVPAGTILIFTCEKADKRKKLYKEIEKNGKVYELDRLPEGDLKNFIIKRLRLSGKVCKAYVLNELIHLSGYYHKETQYNLYNLENDLKKMIAHSTGEEIIASDVVAAISGDLETEVFAMTDAAGRGRNDEAFRLLFNILGTGESVYKLLALLISQFELMLSVKELGRTESRAAGMAQTLGVHEFRVKKALGFSERYTEQRLKEILMDAYETDIKIKSGLLDPRTAIELLVAEL